MKQTIITINRLANSTYNLVVTYEDQFIWKEEIKGWSNVPRRLKHIMPFLFREDSDYENGIEGIDYEDYTDNLKQYVE